VARVTSGCGSAPPRFCPESQVSRAELAVLLVRSKRGTNFVPPPARGVFSDVPPSSSAAPYIEQLFRDGVTSGCGPGVFCPEALVTRAEMAVFLVRMRRGASVVPPPLTGVFVDVPASHWAARYIEQLFRDRITNGCADSPRRFCPDSRVTRAEAAVFLQRTFTLPIP
jgi:S-layer family protein